MAAVSSRERLYIKLIIKNPWLTKRPKIYRTGSKRTHLAPCKKIIKTNPPFCRDTCRGIVTYRRKCQLKLISASSTSERGIN